MAALQKLSLHCKLGDYLKTELRNQFVYGLRNQRIQGRLLETANLTMESALKTASGMELAEKGISELKSEAAVTVDFVGAGAKVSKKRMDGEVKSEGQMKNNKHGRKTNSSVRTNKSKLKPSHNSKTFSNNVSCYRCGRNHLAPDCTLPRHIKCHECGGLGHLQKVCKKKCKTQLLEEVYKMEELEHSRFRDRFTVSLSLSGEAASHL